MLQRFSLKKSSFMKIKDILELENSNINNIILHKEGLFWRAYEKSAYLFTLYIKAHQITKKYYKNVNSNVVYLGFPQSSFSKIETICKKQNLSFSEENNQKNTINELKNRTISLGLMLFYFFGFVRFTHKKQKNKTAQVHSRCASYKKIHKPLKICGFIIVFIGLFCRQLLH